MASSGCSSLLPDYVVSTDDIFSVLDGITCEFKPTTKVVNCLINPLVSCESSSLGFLQEVVVEGPKSKRRKVSVAAADGGGSGNSDGQHKVSHIAVERNRRKQMNEHLSVLRSLLPCFYVKRGDQASVIGGVVDYITELQQILQFLDAKKQRKLCSELVLSPRLVSSSRTLPISPRKPTVSLRPSLPISPRTPQPSASPYKPILPQLISPSLDISPTNSYTNSDSGNELVANSRSAVAEVEVKFSGGNLVLTTCSNRVPGQVTKVIDILENLSLEVLQVNISVVDDTMVNSFTIKIGVGCLLSAEELAEHIQQTFC